MVGNLDPTRKEIQMATVNEAGAKGGRSKSDLKRLTAKANAAKAREAKLQYRLDPTLRKEKSNGNQG